jgi:bacillithiol system protein YtxJ
MEQIQTKEQFDALVESEDFFLLKHSNTCPISQAAYEEYEEFINESSVKSYYLIVQTSRDLSNYIADRFQIKHESPQALLFKKGEVAWNASHWKITSKALSTVSEENSL